MVSRRLAHLFGLRWVLGREGYDPCDAWAPEDVLGWPPGLTYRNGAAHYYCVSCGELTEWPLEPEEYDEGDPNNLCGGSPRCCP